jgi:hypothetical protein
MSLILMPSDQHYPHIPDGHTPIMPGQPGYRVYLPNQAQLGQTPDSAGHDHYGLISHLTTSTPHHEGHAGYQPFGSSADANANSTSTANAYPIADHASAFTPSNRSTNSHTTPTISPSQTQFDANDATQFYEDTDAKGRHDSLYPKEEAASPMTTPPSGRRRPRNQYAEPGSARAIYLEKNRKAASKCRTKQKQEQEQLVETSREAERRNRVLKAELNLLEQERRQPGPSQQN